MVSHAYSVLRPFNRIRESDGKVSCHSGNWGAIFQVDGSVSSSHTSAVAAASVFEVVEMQSEQAYTQINQHCTPYHDSAFYLNVSA